MKTIGFIDRSEGRTIRMYQKPQGNQITVDDLLENSQTRYHAALKELQHMGNIDIYLIRGNKYRKIAEHLI